MKAFIFKYVDNLTNCYHCGDALGGGLVVISENLESAKEFVKKDRYCRPTEEEWNKAMVYDIEAKEPTMYIFRDVGCCDKEVEE